MRLDFKPKTWEERLVLFVGFLIQNNRKSTTIRSYISAIKCVLRQDGEELNEDVYLLKSLTKACQLKNDKVHTQLPIRKGLIHLILANLLKIFSGDQSYLTKLYRALYITTYYGLFRIGEVTKSDHVIKACDVHTAKNKNKMMFVLHSSKTHWFNVKPQIVKIQGLTDHSKKNKIEQGQNQNFKICPFDILKDYVSVRGRRKSDSEQFFVFKDSSPVLPYHARKTLAQLLKFIGLNHKLYKFTSIRGGRATDLAAMKIDLGIIRILGRWRSSAVFSYLKT